MSCNDFEIEVYYTTLVWGAVVVVTEW